MAEYIDASWPGLSNGATRAERRPCDYRAYVPDPLVGRPLRLSGQRSADIGDVERRLLVLNMSERPLVGLEALARLLLRAEAVASSFIEGLQIDVRCLAKADVAARSGVEAHDDTARAVLGNVRAMESALKLADASSIRVDDVLELHRKLLEGTRDAPLGGLIRTEQNRVGGTGMSPCTADFVPPPPDRVPDLLEDLCAYMSGDDHPALVQASIVHAQFETIHPFVDGNGRTGRALIHLILRRRGLATRFVPPISLILASHANAYIAALTTYRYEGDADSPEAQEAIGICIDRFIADTARAIADTDRFGMELDALEAEWRRKAGKVRAASSVDLLLRMLPSAPVLTVTTAAELIGRSVQRANDAINHLVAAGVLKQTTIGRRNRAFETPDLIKALTGFERALAGPLGDTRQAPPTRPVPYRDRRA
ncbi:Fic family protein [Streptosporangium sp. NPDC023615]|uniref:Fic family protein n=1 Tax=Streptosporangium sp. NPDC023615 TaxID=3154794 RepID=UPI0034306EDE